MRVGHWEGDTLVVDRPTFDPRTSGIGANGGGRISDALTITERITCVSADLLIWRMTVDDPKTWTRPFTIELPLKRDDSYGMFEDALPRRQLRVEEHPQRRTRRGCGAEEIGPAPAVTLLGSAFSVRVPGSILIKKL